MLRRNLIGSAAAFIVAAGMVMGTLVTVNPARAAETCHKINTKGEGQIDFATNSSEGQLLGGGLLRGTTHGEFSFTSFNPDTGIATYEGTFTITTEHGTLSLHLFDGVFNVGTGEFSNDSDVIDGTGRFEEAAGGLFFEGVVAPDGSFTDDVTGEICLGLAP